MISVLRLGHRRTRDRRITTHVGLTARAFGAEKIVLTGEKDDSVIHSLQDVATRWGGTFAVEYKKSWRTLVKQFPGTVIHLTMYGLPLAEVREELVKQRKSGDALIVVGGEKVPREIYDYADFNVAVGNQPHSEVAALAVLLYELTERKIKTDFEDAELRIEPHEHGKHVEKIKE